MTDAEFDKIDAEFIRLVQGKRHAARRHELAAVLSRCRDCDRNDPESYMLPRSVWLEAVPSGRGRLCLRCLSRRLGRKPRAADFSDPPCTKNGGRVRFPIRFTTP